MALITIFDDILTLGAINSSINIADPESLTCFLLNSVARKAFAAVVSTNVTERTTHDGRYQRAKVFLSLPMKMIIIKN